MADALSTCWRVSQTWLESDNLDWLDVNGVSLRYELLGEGAETLVMIHEIGGSLDSWDGLVRQLSQRFRILRYDQRGSGLSEKVRQSFTLDDLVDDLEALLARLEIGPTIHFVATAFGAAQAVVAATRRHRRIGSMVLCSPALDVDESRSAFMQSRADRAAAEGMRAVLPITLERAYPEQARKDNAAYLRYRGRYLANDAHCFALTNKGLANVVDRVGSIDCPILIAAGRHDVVRPPEKVAPLAKLAKLGRYKIVDAAHFIPVQAPGLLLDAMNAFYQETLGHVSSERISA